MHSPPPSTQLQIGGIQREPSEGITAQSGRAFGKRLRKYTLLYRKLYLLIRFRNDLHHSVAWMVTQPTPRGASRAGLLPSQLQGQGRSPEVRWATRLPAVHGTGSLLETPARPQTARIMITRALVETALSTALLSALSESESTEPALQLRARHTTATHSSCPRTRQSCLVLCPGTQPILFSVLCLHLHFEIPDYKCFRSLSSLLKALSRLPGSLTDQ